MNTLTAINDRVSAAGGSAYLVGGAVIDRLSGREPKDLDIEIFGLSLDQLSVIFDDCSPNLVGQAFGIIKITLGGEDIDLSVPRRDNKAGVGHRGFIVEVDPSMTIREAAMRRDFTINSMSVSLADGSLLDPFGGLADLESGILRVTDPATFVEDPLRVLRAMQLLARKAQTVEAGSLALMRGMISEFASLPAERVGAEFTKLFMKASKPSVGLGFLVDSGWIECFPELAAMIGCEQNKEWHPEGDVWTHALLAADAAASIRHLVPADQAESFVMSAFLHDIGKPATTVTQAMIDAGQYPQDRLLTAYGHDEAGRDPAEAFLRRCAASNATISRVRALVGAHMQPHNLVTGNAGRGAWLRLAMGLHSAGTCLRVLGRICQCDACATGTFQRGRSISFQGETSWEHRTSAACFAVADQIDSDAALAKPVVLGRHLIARGVKPGVGMGDLLRAALNVQLNHDIQDVERILDIILA